MLLSRHRLQRLRRVWAACSVLAASAATAAILVAEPAEAAAVSALAAETAAFAAVSHAVATATEFTKCAFVAHATAESAVASLAT